MQPSSLTINLPDGGSVSGLLLQPNTVHAAYLLAHGAGAGMRHPFLAHVAEQFAARGIATLRYQFPYMEQGGRRPDRPAVATATVRAAVAVAAARFGNLPLFAGGRSFGGRMTSQAQAEAPLPHVRGLVFLGFPLHAAKRPATERAQHLAQVQVPMLFLQGTRDALAEHALITRVVDELGGRATLVSIAEGDHSFHVPARTGRTDDAVIGELCDAIAEWIATR